MQRAQRAANNKRNTNDTILPLRRMRGQAMAEFLVVASFASTALFAMPVLTEYSSTRMQTVAAARLVAWQRTAWLPKVISASDERGVVGATRKDDMEIERDLKRHVFRNRRAPGLTIHSDEAAEFSGKEISSPVGTTVKVSTTEVKLPNVLNVTDVINNAVSKAQQTLGGTDITRSLGNFSFVTGGYLRNQVDVNHEIRSFGLHPNAGMSAQVTMLTEPWNAGGTIREEVKVQGLVPMKMADLPFMQQIRNTTQQVARQIQWIIPGFDVKLLEFGLQPGRAEEKTPYDRFEITKEAEAGKIKDVDDRFRYYRAFPPTPVLKSLP